MLALFTKHDDAADNNASDNPADDGVTGSANVALADSQTTADAADVHVPAAGGQSSQDVMAETADIAAPASTTLKLEEAMSIHAQHAAQPSNAQHEVQPVRQQDAVLHKCWQLLDRIGQEQQYAMRNQSNPHLSCPVCFEPLTADSYHQSTSVDDASSTAVQSLQEMTLSDSAPHFAIAPQNSPELPAALALRSPELPAALALAPAAGL